MKDMCYQAEQPKTKPDLYIYSWSLRPEKQNQETKRSKAFWLVLT